MPFVAGFLRVRRRRPSGPVDPGYGVDDGGQPDQGLPPGEDLVDPGYGIEGPDVDPPSIWPSPGRPTHPIHLPLPRPPPGIWPGPTPGHPIVPVPPDLLPPEVGGGPIVPGTPEHPIYQPGTIWPPVNATGKYFIVAWIPGQGWKYIVIDPSLKLTHPIELPERQPK